MSAFFGVSSSWEIFVTLLVITDPRASCRCSPARPAAGRAASTGGFVLLLVALGLLTGKDRRPAAVRHRGAATDRRGSHARQGRVDWN